MHPKHYRATLTYQVQLVCYSVLQSEAKLYTDHVCTAQMVLNSLC